MMQGDVALFLRIEFHQRKFHHPYKSVILFRDQTEFFGQVQTQIAERIVHDLGAVGGE